MPSAGPSSPPPIPVPPVPGHDHAGAADAGHDDAGGERPGPVSARTTVRRASQRASYDREAVDAILDEGLVCHVGVSTDDGPVVIPMAYARDGDRLLLHGSPASRLLRSAKRGLDCCVTVTLLDGLVLARSAFHHSFNYRSVVVMGRATAIDDLDERRAALDLLVEAIVPGRAAEARPPDEREMRATVVLSLPLEECSVKARTGGPIEEDEDMALPVWAGVVPLALTPGAPLPDPAQQPPLPLPPCVTAYTRPGPAPDD